MSRVSVRSVRPHNLHKFRTDDLVLRGLTDGLNVVYAPNASGKSTLAKAIRLMFKPEKGELQSAKISAELAIDSVEIAEARWAESSAIDKYPGFPEQSHLYVLDVISLVSGLDKNDREFLGKLVGNGVTYSGKKTPAMTPKERGLLNSVRDDLTKALADAREISRLSEDLPRLENEVRSCEQAKTQLDVLALILNYRQAESQKSSLEAELHRLQSEYPGIEKQSTAREGEIGLLTDRLTSDRINLEQRLVALQQFNPSSPFPNRDLQDSDLEHIRSLESELQQIKLRLQQTRSDYEQKVALAEGYLGRIRSLVADDRAAEFPNVGRAKLDEFLHLARAADTERSDAAKVSGLNSAVESIRRDMPVEILSDREFAELWQKLEQLPEQAAEPVDNRPWIIAGLLAIGAALLFVLDPILGRIAMIVAALASVAVGFLAPKANPTHPEQAPIDVKEALRQLGDAAVAKSKELAIREIESKASEGVREVKWPEIATSSGFNSAGTDAYLLEPIFVQISEYQRALAELSPLRAILDLLASQADQLQKDLDTLAEDAFLSTADGWSVPIAGRFKEWMTLLKAHQDEVARSGDSERSLSKKLDEAGVPELPTLNERIDSFNARRDAAKIYRRVVEELSRISACSHPSAGELELVADILANQLPGIDELEYIESMIAGLRERVDALSSASVTYGAVSSQVEKDDSLKKIRIARQAYETKRLELERKYQSKGVESATYHLYQHLNTVMRTRDLPDIALSANRWINRFTGGRYQLILAELSTGDDPGLGSLRVLDQNRGNEHPFSQLSTGTKVHIMLGIRLGLIEENERVANNGMLKFPLITDETTAVSDPIATREIFEAMIEIAQERQVIFFTNKPADVLLLKEMVPGLKETLITSEVPALEVVQGGALSEYSPAPGQAELDLMEPIVAHHPELILPPGMASGATSFAAMGLQMPRELVARLEQARVDLVSKHPLLRWEEARLQDWTRGSKRAQLEEAIQKCNGNALAALQNLNGISGLQTKQKAEARTWLEDNGYLAPPPEAAFIRALVEQHLSAVADSVQISHFVNLFLRGY